MQNTTKGIDYYQTLNHASRHQNILQSVKTRQKISLKNKGMHFQV